MNPRPPHLEPLAGVDLTHEAAFRLGRTEVRPSTLELFRDGRATTVERKVMQALVVLARRQGQVTSRDELIEQVWAGRFIGEDAIHRVMAKLRQAAEVHCGGDFALDTIPRVGYRLVVGDVRDAAAPTARNARWRPGRRTWIAGAAALVLALSGAAALHWWPQPATRPPVVRLVAFSALGPDVPASLPASLTDDSRAAFGTDNVVILRDRDPDVVLSGVVRRIGDKLRLAVQLKDARDGTMLWSGVREWPAAEKVSPRFNAVNVTQILRCGLIDGAGLPPHALALYLQYCDARFSIVPQHERGLAIVRRLVEEEPGFAIGWSSLAWSAEGTIALDPKRADTAALHAEATAAAARALSIDPRHAQAYAIQAWQLPPLAHAARERLLRRAAESRLTACGCEVVNYAGSLMLVGRIREAVVQYQRADQREPVGSHAAYLSIAYAVLGDATRSDEAFGRFSELFADTPGFLSVAMQRAAYAGQWAEAGRLAASGGARPQSREALIAAFEALATSDAGRIAAARPAVRKVADEAPDVSFYSVVLAALGDRPAALDVMERTIADDPVQPYYPPALSLRHEPRYLRLLQQQGLIEYWRETRTRPDMCRAANPPAFCATLG